MLIRKGVTEQRFLEELLELVAVGTVADLMELTGENRSIVKFGLRRLKDTKNKGLRALIDIAGLSNKSELSAYNIGFQITPRINAAGRLEDAKIIVDLLDTDDSNVAYKIANTLNDVNRKRQMIQERMITDAFSILEDSVHISSNVPYAIVMAGENWHRGVVGLVASKIAELYYRPSFVISIENDIGYGSARSINGFSVVDAVDQASNILIKYSGHEQAAGFEIHRIDIPTFECILNEYAKKVLTCEKLLLY